MSTSASRLTNQTLDATLDEARAAFAAANPMSRQRHEAAKSVMPGGNTRTVLHYSPFPVTIVKGEGARIWDADGHEYTDFLGEYTAGLYGHNNAAIAAAVKTALEAGITLGGPNMIEARLARLLCERFPALERVRFCNSGTEANILALSAARAFTGRSDVIVASGSYHGSVLGFAGDYPLNLPFAFNRMTYNDTRGAVDLIQRLNERLAAVIVEPMIGAGGGIPATREFLEGLRQATEEVGALLIFDEVMTSRLTAGGLQSFYGVTPDLATLGKYLGGGLSFGGFGGRADILDRFDPQRSDHWPHAGTFNNNVLTMAAGHAGLSEVYTPEAADAFFARGNAFRKALAERLDGLGLPIQLTGLGSMMVFHFARRAPSAPTSLEPLQNDLLELIHLDMLARGQYYARRGMINLCLPTTDADLDRFAHDFVTVLEGRAELITAAVA
jgi:glutamate-1-semialdehyde 2,1-aminomutase